MFTPDRIAIAIIACAFGYVWAAMTPHALKRTRDVIDEMAYYLMWALIIAGGVFVVWFVLHVVLHKV